MPDPDSPPPLHAVERLRDYRNDRTPATPSLEASLQSQIAAEGPLPFVDFMEAALYHPVFGYYARESRQVGRNGDFFTSVSVGPLFGELLTRRFLQMWNGLGCPDRWRIIECGAHDGTLAADILRAMARLDARAFAALEYVISEPLPLLQAAQRETLAPFQNTIRLIEDLAAISEEALPGIAFGNELLDALPFHLLEWRSGDWHECRVATGKNGGFDWEVKNGKISPELFVAVAELGNDFPEGYRTEVRTNFREFLGPLTQCLTTGLLLFADYGFARPEYYHPARITGTLRTFSKHRAGEDPLGDPGSRDITAHVDFTAFAEAAISLGCHPLAFQDQGAWLTAIAHEWLLSLEGRPDPELFRQFQTLVHPAHLGRSFHVLELAWNLNELKIARRDLDRLALQACPVPG